MLALGDISWRLASRSIFDASAPMRCRCAQQVLMPIVISAVLLSAGGCADSTAPDPASRMVWNTAVTLNVGGRGGALEGIWGSSPNDIWVVASDGTIHHFNGTSWSSEASGSTNLSAVWGTSANDVWTVGSQTILHYDGASWSSVSNVADGAILTGVSGTSSSQLWAVGFMISANVGSIAHYDGTRWSSFSLTYRSGPFAVWGASSSDVWAVGYRRADLINSGSITHYDGSSWSTVSPNDSSFLRGVWGASRSSIWAVGEEGAVSAGTIVFYDGVHWSRNWTGNALTPLYSVWGTSGTNVWAVGDVVLHFNGGRWSSVPSPISGTLRGVWASSPRDVWAVGGNQVFHATLPL